jgi:flagellar biosynthesis chaperone FliJ
MKYRIKIKEKNNGDKRYCPQVKSGGVFSSWKNLHWNRSNLRVEIDNKYDKVEFWKFSIDKAKEVINLHKKQVEKEQGEKVKTIKYIKL